MCACIEPQILLQAISPIRRRHRGDVSRSLALQTTMDAADDDGRLRRHEVVSVLEHEARRQVRCVGEESCSSTARKYEAEGLLLKIGRMYVSPDQCYGKARKKKSLSMFVTSCNSLFGGLYLYTQKNVS